MCYNNFMNKERKIKKHVNIHIITLLSTIFVVVLLDLTKMYSISPSAMMVFLVVYTLYIIISTVIMISKK